MSMTLRFWGVRGSVATPGHDTAHFGGNTSCLELEANGSRLILDAGTGIRSLGYRLMAEAPLEATLLLSHLHWDHIQGLPFFAPLYRADTQLTVAAATSGGRSVRETLRAHMSPPTFPVHLDDVPARLEFLSVKDRQTFRSGAFTITAGAGNHPDSVMAYRISDGQNVIVYATDTEHYSCVDPRLRALAQDADILIYDAQYLPEEYDGRQGMSRVGWGHSTFEAGAALAEAAGVGQLLLFHHDPLRTDSAVLELERRARQRFASTAAAREGMSLVLGAERLAEAA